MKSTSIENLRQKLRRDEPVFGLWVTLESPSITEMAVALGLDWVVIDAEHGHLDWKEIVEHVRATVRSDTVALVRIAELNGGLIKRALDIGADGVVIPWIETADQLRQALAFGRYPLEGVRGIGAERATCWGQAFQEHTAEANDRVLIVPILETVRAADNIHEIVSVDGVDLFFFGPADFSSSAGHRGQWEGPGVADQLLRMKEVIRSAGKHVGVVATSHENLSQRQQQGFRAIALGLDTGLLLRSLRASLAFVGRDQAMQTSMIPTTSKPALLPTRPAESFRPDRSEVMTSMGRGSTVEIAPGVQFEGLVGSFNGARRLTTGIVTIAPDAHLPYHTHPFTESITLLRGSVTVEAEGRRYHLQPRDNAVLPRDVAHEVRNASFSESAVLHIALGTDEPSRVFVDGMFVERMMPAESTGHPGAERINRIATAPRTSAGPNTEFIDSFNADLVPGIEVSGGYALFYPGGRLPAHLHDFDESICIIGGEATCVVEGRRYALSSCETAMVPRGRIHYFINESSAPMEMVWVYAGPRPERILVDETCATIAGSPWK